MNVSIDSAFSSAAHEFGWFNLSFPFYLQPDGSKNIEVVRKIYVHAIEPVLHASTQIMLFNSDFGKMDAQIHDAPWKNEFVKRNSKYVLEDSGRKYLAVPTDFWCGELTMAFAGASANFIRGIALIILPDKASLASVIKFSTGAHVTVNLAGKLGITCMRQVRKILKENPAATIVVLGPGRASVSSMAIIPGEAVFDNWLNEVLESCKTG